MYSNLFSEVVNPDIFHMCGKRVHWREIQISLSFTLKGKEENESALDHPIAIAYYTFFTLMVRRKFDKIKTKREKIRKRHYKETMTFYLRLKTKREIFSFLSFYHQGRLSSSHSILERREEGKIPNLNFFKPFSFADGETVAMWDIRDQPPIYLHMLSKKKTPISLFRKFLIRCGPI